MSNVVKGTMPMKEFQPVLVSWKTPTINGQWIKVVCTTSTQLDYCRKELQGIKHYEQRIYSA